MSASEPVFRKAIRADLEAIIRLLADDDLGRLREDASTPPNRAYTDAFADIDADPNQLLAVVDLDGVVAGCMQLSFIPGLSHRGMLRGQIESVRVASSRRGSGLGRGMFAWAIETCRARGCGLVQLATDRQRPDARRFYESLGFVASHDGMKLRF